MEESPAWDPMLGRPAHEFQGFYNWTMTYRRDSDFPIPYYEFKLKEPLPFDVNDNYKSREYIKEFGGKMAGKFVNKTKPAAWFVSNCGALSKRQDYVKSLETMLEVNGLSGCKGLWQSLE